MAKGMPDGKGKRVVIYVGYDRKLAPEVSSHRHQGFYRVQIISQWMKL